MRLIDADALLKQLLESKDDEIIKAVIGLVQTQPTVYDIEKVVEQLEEKLTCEDYGTCGYCQYRWCPMVLLEADEAIDIVRKGGAE